MPLPSTESFEAVPGFGVSATVEGRKVDVGADRFMTKLGLDVADFAGTAARLGAEGKSPLYAAIDGRLAAVIAVADPIKPSTPEAIAALHALGLKVAMITGDNRRTAEAIARRLGIDEVRGRGAARRQGRRREAAARRRTAASPSSATASTTRRRSPRPISASPSAPAPTSPSRAPTWC